MFLTIQQGADITLAYEYSTPRRSIRRAVRSRRYWAWRVSSFIMLFPSAAVVFFIFTTALMSAAPVNQSEKAIEAAFLKLVITMAPWAVLMMIGIVFSGKAIEIKDIQQKVVRRKMRELYVTDEDWSFKVMFPRGAAFDFKRPKLVQVVNEFFADPDVISADQLITKSMLGNRKAVEEYKAKLKLIHLAQATYLSHRLADSTVLAEFSRQRASLDQEMHPLLEKELEDLEEERRSLQKLVTDTQPSEALQ